MALKRKPEPRKSTTPEQDKYPPNGGGSRKVKNDFDPYGGEVTVTDDTTQDEQDIRDLEEEIARLRAKARKEVGLEPETTKTRGRPGTSAQKPKTRVNKSTTTMTMSHKSDPFNEIFASGRVFGDPELRFTSKGRPEVTFKLAIHTGKDQEGNYRPSVWKICKMYTGAAENLMSKEDIYDRCWLKIYGRLAQNSWTPEGSDKKVYFDYILVDYYEVAPPRGEG